MTTTIAADADHDPSRSTRRKLSRYTLITLVGSPTNLALYLVILTALDWPALAANLAAATVIAPATYLANRRWVWGRRTPHSLRREILPYWAMTLVSVLAASATLAVLELAGAPLGLLAVTPLLVYALLWIARFVLLDRWLFPDTAATT